MYAYDTIYNDTDVKQIESLAPTQLHRSVDLAIVEADKQGKLSNPFWVARMKLIYVYQVIPRLTLSCHQLYME